MSDLKEFHRELIADVQGDADALGLIIVEAFFEKMGDILTEAGELEGADRAYFEGRGAKGVAMQVDGYGGDPRDASGVLSLVLCDFDVTDEPRQIKSAEIKPRFNRLVEFLQHARQPEFRERMEETSAGFGLADLIATTWNSTTKIKIIILTNADNRMKVDGIPAGTIDSKPVTYTVWDLKRIQKYVESGQAREDLEIDFENDFGGAIPVLRASGGDAALESYVAVIPGTQLGEIYEKWGTRLLEANVRSFLQARGKVNQKIRETLEEHPEMFFAYNNGITVTANSIEIRETTSGPVLISASNLQIVNGGQTTASIHAARRQRPNKPKALLDEVFVQMKLSIIPPDQAEETVPKISEYANSQNKVNAADFFSNHPFHIRMEGFSRRILAPAGSDAYRESKWFYERARGQYADARGSRTVAERKKFDLEYPRKQFFTKTDLAKFENSWAGQPEIVSLGAQKNFAAFAKAVGAKWTKSEIQFGEVWFKRIIAKSIIFRALEKLVPTQPWYEGGYRANIVTYTMAKISHDATEMEKNVDLDAVWRAQSVPQALEDALVIAAAEAHDVITSPPEGIRNMSEWAKKQACWEILKKRSLTYRPSFMRCLIDPEEAKTVVVFARKDMEMTAGIQAQTSVLECGANFWREAKSWGMEHRKLSPKETGILDTCASIPIKMPTDKQCVIAMEVLGRLRADGFQSEEQAIVF
ncbi:AIPR family protein [Candidatus Halocynthiibacter alkanivorans]|uniref:AIPR family protein n=1 Tax=Candidatus Halocynthiibacter alkanivorans TaxID=2267619 RepID=UPI000DF476C0|nr:AIPR family protein [Candidatus Halocynthiibacter alkanivorans]